MPSASSTSGPCGRLPSAGERLGARSPSRQASRRAKLSTRSVKPCPGNSLPTLTTTSCELSAWAYAGWALGGLQAPQRWQRRWWLSSWWQGSEQVVGDPGDLGHGQLEGLLSCRRSLLHAAHLADVLSGCGLDLLWRRHRVQTPEGGDVPTHAHDARAPTPRSHLIEIRALCP